VTKSFFYILNLNVSPTLSANPRKYRDLSLKKRKDPEIWITELENIYMKLENMGLFIAENNFMIYSLNNLTSDYALMERRVGDADQPLTVEEVRGELNLKFETLNMKSSCNEEDEGLEE
jgi:hypothetical protein